MSHTDLYAVYRTKATHLHEFTNSWGSAPMLWGYLNKQFLGGPFTMPFFDKMQPLWNLAQDAQIPDYLRTALVFTFDWAICSPESRHRLELDLRKTHVALIEDSECSWSHFSAIADALRSHRPNKKMIGYGLSCTSVSDPWSMWSNKNDKTPWRIFEDYIDIE